MTATFCNVRFIDRLDTPTGPQPSTAQTLNLGGKAAFYLHRERGGGKRADKKGWAEGGLEPPPLAGPDPKIGSRH